MGADEYRERWPEMRMKHLELLQAAIARMGSNSSNLKSYTITIVAGFIGLTVVANKPGFLLLLIPVVSILAVLDTNYLRIERAFRDRFDAVRLAPLDHLPDFAVAPLWNETNSRQRIFISWSILGFYGPIMAMIIAASLLL